MISFKVLTSIPQVDAFLLPVGSHRIKEIEIKWHKSSHVRVYKYDKVLRMKDGRIELTYSGRRGRSGKMGRYELEGFLGSPKLMVEVIK